MSYKFIFQFFISLLIYGYSYSQEYSYTNFNIKNGLAGSTAYCITQDKDGFIWIGTETGVSRFDGTHFKNFTSSDGLPDAEILQIFADSKGRIWMAPFSRSVCYYYKGKIHNQDNDSILKKIELRGNVAGFAEDKYGTILIRQRTKFVLLKTNDEIKEYTSLNNLPIQNCLAASRSASGNFLVEEAQIVYEFAEGHFTPVATAKMNPWNHDLYMDLAPKLMISRESYGIATIKSLPVGEKFDIVYSPTQISYSIIDDSLVCANSSDGTTEFSTKNISNPKKFLPGISVTRTFKDDEGNKWFTTIGQGIFKLNSEDFKNITLAIPGFGIISVYSIKKTNNELLLGLNNDHVCKIKLPLYRDKSYFQISKFQTSENIVFIDILNNGNPILGSNMKMIVTSPDFKKYDYLDSMNFKDAWRKSDSEMLVATSWNVFKINPNNLHVLDTFWRGRATAIYLKNDTGYVGTLSGLYLVTKDKKIIDLGEKIPFLRRRISGMVESKDGSLWIATYNSGILQYKDGAIRRTITTAQGLTSDICRNILCNKNFLWVGTDKGLNKIDLNDKNYPVTIYTSQDGLNSDLINVVHVADSTVYVGTPAGLSFFDDTKLALKSSCRLVLLDIMNGDTQLSTTDSNFALHYNNNKIRFDYAGISYKSIGKVSYKYRLMGLDSTWKFTDQNFLDYPTLPSGKYQLQLIAINKFALASKPITIDFAVETPFWQTTWFIVIAIVLVVLLIWMLITLRIRSIRQKEKEKEMIQKKIIEMEYTALRAQMNPHFIFNCLNSIQQYIFDKDVFAANKYISRFAKLIRTTLQNSSSTLISIDDEIEYLSTYLELEKLRFKDKMNYSIEIDASLKDYELFIPTMILQPYVENCIRHGIRHKEDGDGHVWIKMLPDKGNTLVCIIEDNGIGRKKSMSYKTKNHIEYQSKGMSLTSDRIKLMNSAYGNEIRIQIIDLEDLDHEPCGTRIVLEFPIYERSTQKENL